MLSTANTNFNHKVSLNLTINKVDQPNQTYAYTEKPKINTDFYPIVEQLPNLLTNLYSKKSNIKSLIQIIVAFLPMLVNQHVYYKNNVLDLLRRLSEAFRTVISRSGKKNLLPNETHVTHVQSFKLPNFHAYVNNRPRTMNYPAPTPGGSTVILIHFSVTNSTTLIKNTTIYLQIGNNKTRLLKKCKV